MHQTKNCIAKQGLNIRELTNKTTYNMNVKQLIGLAAIVLGGMTSCSNILEEDGIGNSVSNGDQGYLAISLDQNKEISVLTKTVQFDSEQNQIDLDDTEIGKFKITVKNKTDDSQITELTGDYSTIKGKQVAVDPGEYSLSATYGSMNDQTFAYDSPCFTGSANVKVVKGKLATGQINCTLSNSIIQFENFTTLANQVDISKLVAVVSTNVSEDVNNGFSLYENNTLKPGILYVQSNVSNAKIVLQGSLKSDSRVTFTAEAKLENTTDAAKVYKISYNINSTQGSLTIEVNVNGKVTPTSIEVNFDPYNPTPSEES